MRGHQRLQLPCVYGLLLLFLLTDIKSSPKKGLLHRSYSLNQKKKVAAYAKIHGVRPTARHFGVSRKNIQRWMKEKLDEAVKPTSERKNKKGQGRKLSYPPYLDDNLLQWFHEKCDQGLNISVKMLKERGREIICPTHPTFKASDGWAKKFMRRHNISKTSSKQLSLGIVKSE